MPEWPPLILDQANNLLVSFFIQGVKSLFLLMPSTLCTMSKVANETSGVRRIALPVGQTAKLYCPKKSFENYPG